MNKKIVFFSPISNFDSLRGSERANYNVAKYLKSQGFYVIIITSELEELSYFKNLIKTKSLSPSDSIDGIKVIRLRTNNFINFMMYLLDLMSIYIPILNHVPYGVFFYKKEVFETLKSIKPDYIYSSILPYYHNELLVQSKSVLKKSKLIIRADIHPFQKKYLIDKNKHVLINADVIQTSTNAEKEILLKSFSLKERKIIVLPPAIHQNTLKKTPEGLRLRKLNGKKIILFIGKKSKDKGAILLLRTVKNLVKKDSAYILITTGKSSLEWKINKLIYGGNYLIDFDWVSEEEKRKLITTCNIFCMPSTVESFGLVYLEAWREKKPVIAVKSPITTELIENNHAGIVLKTINMGELETAIKTLMNNQRIAKRFGQNGYSAFKRRFIFNKKLKRKYLNLFRK